MDKTKLLTIPALIAVCVLMFSCTTETGPEWRPLFNGENLDGWDIKFSGYELNHNFNNSFRVEDGLLTVSFDEWDTFNGEFGHIFYDEPFSHYKLRVEYRFVGEQVNGGPAWAYRNNGIMFHSQSAASMELDQDFPASVEAQLLGGDGENERPTMNVCTPETHIMIDGQLRREHCINSTSETFHGDRWVTVELHVYGDSLIHHIVEQDTVFTYHNPQLSDTGEPLTRGYIALQAESHPTQFRKVEILDLSDQYE